MSNFKEPISEIIWDLKYRYRWQGQIKDQTIEDTWRRVSKAVAKAEIQSEQARWQQDFYRILENFQFLPGGRILAGAGTRHQVTLFNCFVMDIQEDSLRGIFDALEEGALTLQQGGGVGYDFSVLRPEGSEVKKTGAAASGPVSFMRIWDSMCSVLQSTGARRGAMMAVMRCDHPDIMQFINAKSDPHELRHFNLSVMVSDAFMSAVQRNEEWSLVFPVRNGETGEIIQRQWGDSLVPVPCRVYRRIPAREIWQAIIRSAYAYAEPGVLFADTINRRNNLWYAERINATNPCGEIPLPAYGACDLGAINLTQFVRDAFTSRARMDWTAMEETTSIATRFLDNVIDVSRYPLRVQREQAYATRRLGLGVTGLGDMLVMMGLRYGSDESLDLVNELARRISTVTWQTSIDLAQEKGSFPLYKPEYLQGEFVQTLDESLQKQLAKHGVRNSHHNTVAPAGTISLLANNVSNGIEPIFHAKYDRHIRMSNGESVTHRVQDYAYAVWRHEHSDAMPTAWVDAGELSIDAHLKIQGAMQPYIDNAISKTINIPRDFPFEKIESVYTEAYAMGLKGCTIFRPNAVTGSVLEQPEDQSVDRCCQK
jgi:ribonucleoside-diphosphate reductase alpha chain